jgi:hypothetical protein
LSTMLAVRCVRAELFGLTKIKTRSLNSLYSAWRSMTKLQSTYRELRNRFPYLDSRYARAASFNLSSTREPLHLPKDMFRIVRADGKFAHLFLRIPNKTRQYLWLPLRMSQRSEEMLQGADYGDSKLVRRGDRFFLHLTVKRETETIDASSLRRSWGEDSCHCCALAGFPGELSQMVLRTGGKRHPPALRAASPQTRRKKTTQRS